VIGMNFYVWIDLQTQENANPMVEEYFYEITNN
jgi:hypothetical protein